MSILLHVVYVKQEESIFEIISIHKLTSHKWLISKVKISLKKLYWKAKQCKTWSLLLKWLIYNFIKFLQYSLFSFTSFQPLNSFVESTLVKSTRSKPFSSYYSKNAWVLLSLRDSYTAKYPHLLTPKFSTSFQSTPLPFCFSTQKLVIQSWNTWEEATEEDFSRKRSRVTQRD